MFDRVEREHAFDSVSVRVDKFLERKFLWSYYGPVNRGRRHLVEQRSGHLFRPMFQRRQNVDKWADHVQDNRFAEEILKHL